MPQVVAKRHFAHVAGTACLDFINTVSWPSLANERLQSYDDAARWAVSAGLLKAAEKRRMRASRAELAALVRLRAILRDVFTRRRLTPFNAELKRALPQMRITDRGRWSIDAGAKTIRYRLLWDAASLLTSERMAQLKRCANPTCGWLFLDKSRRGNRRWCSMEDCGNRAKARRYYARVSGRSTGTRRRRRPPRRRGRL